MALYFRPEAALALNDGDRAELAQAAVVSQFFQRAGAPIIGRSFSPNDGELGQYLAVLSYGYWQNRFGGSPVLGKNINFDKRSAQIIGVMPEGCQLPTFLVIEYCRPAWAAGRTGGCLMRSLPWVD